MRAQPDAGGCDDLPLTEPAVVMGQYSAYLVPYFLLF
jgi:hypothetical protein